MAAGGDRPAARRRKAENGCGRGAEDVEPSPSVDSPNDRVDLYGYTSMAIAALQEQRRQIEGLKAEVRELRTQLASKRGKP
jgi:hypothetical protein